MENQHRKINGYRELNQTEIDLMNEVKALGPYIENTLRRIEQHLKNQRQEIASGSPDAVENELRMSNATPERFVALAKTEAQTALMYATRAVAQPEFF